MSSDQSTDSVPGGPPPIPSTRTPPPIPRQRAGISHTPPPVPTKPRPIAINPTTPSEPPEIPSNFRPSAEPPAIPRRAANDAPVNIVVAAPIHHEPVVLSRVALIVSLLCIPLAFLGSFWPFLRSPFWLGALILALLALALTKFTINRSNSGKPTALSKLTMQLSYGFIVIAIIGLIAAAFRASIFLSGTADRLALAIRDAADAQRGTNDALAWIFHKIDVIVSYFGTPDVSSALPAASPTPTPSP
jgi:hypothetical protein